MERRRTGAERVGGVSLHSGRRTERDKKIEKNVLALDGRRSNTTTNQKHEHATQEVKVRRLGQLGAWGERDSIIGGDQVGREGNIIK